MAGKRVPRLQATTVAVLAEVPIGLSPGQGKMEIKVKQDVASSNAVRILMLFVFVQEHLLIVKVRATFHTPGRRPG